MLPENLNLTYLAGRNSKYPNLLKVEIKIPQYKAKISSISTEHPSDIRELLSQYHPTGTHLYESIRQKLNLSSGHLCERKETYHSVRLHLEKSKKFVGLTWLRCVRLREILCAVSIIFIEYLAYFSVTTPKLDRKISMYC